MSLQHPIEILDDEDQLQETKRQFELEKKKNELLQATMGSRFDVIITLLKFDMDGSEQEKDKRLRERFRKFFDYGDKKISLERHQHFCQMRNRESDDELIDKELVLFGVDFLNSKRIKSMFSPLEPKVTWLDDSHCKLTFQNKEQAQEAILKNIRDPELMKVKVEDEMEEIPRCWFQLKPYNQLKFQRKLLCRYASSKENQGAIKSKNYMLYLKAKKKFQEDMARQVEASFEQHVRTLNLTSVLTGRRQPLNRSSNFRRDRRNSRSRSRERRRGNNSRDGPGFRKNNDRRFYEHDNQDYGGRRRDNRNRNDRDGRPRRNRRNEENNSSDQLSICIPADEHARRNNGDDRASHASDDCNYDFLLGIGIENEMDRMNIEDIQISGIEKGEESQPLPAANNQNLDISYGSINQSALNNDAPNLNISIEEAGPNLMNSSRDNYRNPELSFSYQRYMDEQQKEEEQRKKQGNRNNISFVELD